MKKLIQQRIFKATANLLTIALVAILALVPTSTTASAYETNGLMFYFDFSNLSSTANNASLTDLSGNNRNGTIKGSGLTFDSTDKALDFPGGSTGSNYVSLAGAFADFGNGVSIEFEAEFGAQRSAWERIFDFGTTFAGNSTDNQFWVGQMSNSNELAIETWIDGVNQGRCHTVVSGGALGTIGQRTFAKWLITVGDVNGTTKCRIYKNGIELPTRIQDGSGAEVGSVVDTGGSNYPLPKNVTRTSNYLGRSNWPDADFEGSIRYIRMYNTTLTPEQAQQNAVTSYAVTYDEHGGTSVPDGTFTQGGSLTYPTNPTRNGYTFLGWFASATGGTAKTATEVAAGNASTTLHAQWAANTYTVSYEENGGSAVADGSYVYGGTLTYPANPTRSGYTFQGWFDAATGGSALSASTVAARTANSTLHAQWAPLPSQTVTWNPTNTSLLTNQSPATPSSLASTNGDGAISYSVVNAGSTGCAVNSSTGVLTFTGVGACVVKATAASTSNYLTASNEKTFNIGSSSPAMSIDLKMSAGDSVTGSQVSYGADGLKANSDWTLVVRSTPQTLASGTFSNSVLAGSAQIPAGLSAGWHSITLTGLSPSGSTISHAVWFEVSATGTLVQTSGTEPTAQSVSTSSPAKAATETSTLPKTGSDFAGQLAASLLLVLFGLMLIRVRRIS